MRAKYFYSFMVSFGFGVGIETTMDLGYAFALFLLLLGFIVLVMNKNERTRPHRFIVSCILIGCALGVFRTELHQGYALRNSVALDQFVGAQSTVVATLVAESDARDNYVNLVLEVQSVNQGQYLKGTTSSVFVLENPVRMLVRAPAYPVFRYGDKISLVGKIVVPKNFEPEEGKRAFDYTLYLAKDDIFYQMTYPRITLLEHNQGNIVREKLLLMKEFFLRNIARMIPEPESSLGAGILLGAKQSLGEELLQKFRDTGVAHIVVLSGYNIAVVASAIARAASLFPFTMRLTVSALGIVMFALMVGGGATVVRATIMGLIVIFARATGRESVALRALFLAGTFMLLHNPTLLLSDVSFQLSFVATLSLIIFVPILEKHFFSASRLAHPSVMREIFLATVATQIFVLPLLLYHMGSASIIGLIANLAVLPAVPLAMFAVALVAVFGWVPIVGTLLGYFSYTILAYIIFVVELFSKIPYGSLHLKTFPLVFLVGSYVFLGWWIMKYRVPGILERKSFHEF